jgi:hypothetical protein
MPEIEVNLSQIKAAVPKFQELSQWLTNLEQKLYTAPDPKQACGDRTDAFSKQFPLQYQKAGGDNTAKDLHTLAEYVRKLSDGLTQAAGELERGQADAKGLAEQARRNTST